ncbi:MAG: pitrilysin family protein [Aestuariivita sp.]|nr:pitrilysin family protein [Aestuariivita sp.]
MLCFFGVGSAVTANNTVDAVTSFEISNGMKVVVIEDDRAPVVQHMVWYPVGAADEPSGVSGVAHFLEHLMFKATDNLESGELSSIVAANGGTSNAFTSWDYTAYFQRVASDRLELMMEMESDRMRNLRLTENDIVTERQVVIEERNQRIENSPGALFNEQINAAQYLNHQYGKPIIGWRHEIENLQMEDVYKFYNEHYAPNNAFLIVSGDVLPEEVRQLAEKYYGIIPANALAGVRPRSQEPPPRAERRLTYEDARVGQPYISRSYIAPKRETGDQRMAAALTFLAEVLGGGKTSLLVEELQFNQKIAVYAGAFYRGMSRDDTTFDVVVVPTASVSLQEAEDAMDEVIHSFFESGIGVEKLERIKTQIRASEIYARDNAEAVARRYGVALSSGLSVEDVQLWPDKLQAVTEEEILNAARLVLQPERSVTGWLLKSEGVEE